VKRSSPPRGRAGRIPAEAEKRAPTPELLRRHLLRAEEARWSQLRDEVHTERRRRAQQGIRCAGARECQPRWRAASHRLHRKVGSRSCPTRRLRELIMHFSSTACATKTSSSRPARRRLRVPHPRLCRLGRQEGRGVLYARARRPHDGAHRRAPGGDARSTTPARARAACWSCRRSTSTSTAELQEPRLYGQESNGGVWSISKMNMLLHGIADADLQNGDTLATHCTRRAAS
jgi:type I restriction enzyme M protein